MLPVSSAQNAEVEPCREFSEGSEVPVSNHAGPVKTLTVRPLPGEDIIDVIHRLADAVQGATILNQQIFGKLEASAAVTGAIRRTFGKMDWPATWMDGGPCDGNWMAGIQVSVLNHGTVQRIEVDGSVCGSVFEDDAGRHCLVGGLFPALTFPSRSYQTKEVLEKFQSVLSTAGFSLADTIRTWFYLDDILAWYNEFNAARTEIYSGVKFKTGSLPASTGIGASNPAGAALTLAAWAMQPANGARVQEIASPLQCPAPAYGSSFSRAMEISSGSHRQLLISGTASIAPGGETVWRGDTRKQLELTMDVVEAILQSRRYSFADITRATAYFKHSGDAYLLNEWCRTNGLDQLPVVVTHCAVCRDDLLFELEADAAISAP